MFGGCGRNLENDGGLEHSGEEERMLIIILNGNQSPRFLLLACDFSPYP